MRPVRLHSPRAVAASSRSLPLPFRIPSRQHRMRVIELREGGSGGGGRQGKGVQTIGAAWEGCEGGERKEVPSGQQGTSWRHGACMVDVCEVHACA